MFASNILVRECLGASGGGTLKQMFGSPIILVQGLRPETVTTLYSIALCQSQRKGRDTQHADTTSTGREADFTSASDVLAVASH